MAKTTSAGRGSDYIVPLYMNGLQGRMLRMPAPKAKKREILLIYGNRSSLERWYGIAELLNHYGAVTAPDLPGFGGMQSFYKIGQKPTIDALADYLASFIKLRYKRKKLTIVGMSFGFVVATRMLQRYPDLVPKVDLLVSMAGFTHKDDFTFSSVRHWLYRLGTRLLSWRLPAWLYRHTFVSSPVLRLGYGRTHNAKHKLKDVDSAEARRLMDFEIKLWQQNDLRTQMFTSSQFLNLDNCRKTVGLPVWHIRTDTDNYFDRHVVEQHMKVIFSGFRQSSSPLANHAPTMIETKSQAAKLLPADLRRVLARAPAK